jgi:hypothetical protein
VSGIAFNATNDAGILVPDDAGYYASVFVQFDPPRPKPNATGGFTADVTVQETKLNGGQLRWSTYDGGCTVTISSSACAFYDGGAFSGNVDSVVATGSCSEPAQAEVDSGATGQVTIGSFSFTGVVPDNCFN